MWWNTGLWRWIRRGELWYVKQNLSGCIHILRYMIKQMWASTHFRQHNTLLQACLMIDCLLCRLWEEYVQDVTYCGRSGCRRRRVSLAGQPPCEKFWSRVWSVHHQSTLAGHCCSLCARWRQDKVAFCFMLCSHWQLEVFSFLHNVTNQGSYSQLAHIK